MHAIASFSFWTPLHFANGQPEKTKNIYIKFRIIKVKNFHFFSLGYRRCLDQRSQRQAFGHNNSSSLPLFILMHYELLPNFIPITHKRLSVLINTLKFMPVENRGLYISHICT